MAWLCAARKGCLALPHALPVLLALPHALMAAL